MKNIKQRVVVRHRIAAGVLLAAVGAGSLKPLRAAVFDWNNFNSPVPQAWSNAANWSAPGFPGDTAGNLTDTANILIAGTTPSLGGTLTINYSGMPAAALGALTVNTNSSNQGSTDVVVLNINSPLAVTGAASFKTVQPNSGRIVLNLNSALTVGGAVTMNGASQFNILAGGSIAGGALDPFSSEVTLNTTSGTATFASVTAGTGGLTFLGSGSLTVTNGYTTSASNSKNLTINTTGTVSFGSITIGRTLSANADVNSPSANTGVHLQNGVVSTGNFLIGTSDSAAAAEIAGGTLTVTGSSFAVGQNSGQKFSGLFVDGGVLIGTDPAGLVVGRGGGTSSPGGSGIFQISSGTATLEKLTLAGTLATTNAAPFGNKGSLSLSGTGTLYLGTGGLVATTGISVNSVVAGSAYNVILSGGTLAAKAPWSSSADMALVNNPTIQTANAAGAPFNISLTGKLFGSGTLSKAGAGTLTLTNTLNAFTGGLNINAGLLLVNTSTGTALGTGPISVAAGGSIGGIGNNATMGAIAIAAGGHISPGVPSVNAGVGMFNSNSITFSAGGFLDVDIGVVSNDTINMLPGATLTLPNSVNVNVFTAGSGTTFSTPGAYTVFTNVGSIVGDPTNLHVVNGTGSASYSFSLAGPNLVMTIAASAPGNGTWIAAGAGDWTPTANWANGSVPGANAGDSATFGLGTLPSTIALNGVRRVGGLSFNSATATGYTLTPGAAGKLFLDNGSSPTAAVTVYSGTHAINAAAEFTSSVSIAVLNADSVLTFAGGVSGPASGTLTFTGPGTLKVSGALTHRGPSLIGTGTLEFAGNASSQAGTFSGGGLTIDPGATLTSDSVSLSSLTINGTHILRNNGTASGTSKIAFLALAGTGAAGGWTGRLDLTNNALIVQASSFTKSSALSTLKDQVATGVNGAAGITSASVLADPTHLATYVIDNALLGLTQFRGLPVDQDSLLVAATYQGDANFDRKVNVSDLGILATNYGQFVSQGPLQGDFNGNGRVDVADLGALATTYGLGTVTTGFNLVPSDGEIPQVTILAIPEPISGSLLSLALILLLTTRRPRAN